MLIKFFFSPDFLKHIQEKKLKNFYSIFLVSDSHHVHHDREPSFQYERSTFWATDNFFINKSRYEPVDSIGQENLV